MSPGAAAKLGTRTATSSPAVRLSAAFRSPDARSRAAGATHPGRFRPSGVFCCRLDWGCPVAAAWPERPAPWPGANPSLRHSPVRCDAGRSPASPARKADMDSLFPVIGAAVVSTAGAVAAFIFARRLGLTAVQRAYSEESARLAQTQAARIAALEADRAEDRAEIERLERKVAYLQAENDELRRRLSAVESVLADRLEE